MSLSVGSRPDERIHPEGRWVSDQQLAREPRAARLSAATGATPSSDGRDHDELPCPARIERAGASDGPQLTGW